MSFKNYTIIIINTLLVLGYKGPETYKYMVDLLERFGSPIKMEFPGPMPLMVLADDAVSIETLCRSTLENPIRLGFYGLKHVRRSHPENFFQNRTGLLPELVLIF